MKKETTFWITKAEQDFKTVEILLQSNEGPPGIICFHCQQSAEKYVKAFLVEKNIDFPRTHDILLLIERYLLQAYGVFREIIPAATDLTDFATSTRYPDSEEDLDIIAAHDAYKAMIEIKSFILSKINSD